MILLTFKQECTKWLEQKIIVDVDESGNTKFLEHDPPHGEFKIQSANIDGTITEFAKKEGFTTPAEPGGFDGMTDEQRSNYKTKFRSMNMPE